MRSTLAADFHHALVLLSSEMRTQLVFTQVAAVRGNGLERRRNSSVMIPGDRLADILVPAGDEATPDARAARLRLSLEMADAGLSMMRLNLRRRMPHASDDELEAELAIWLHCGSPGLGDQDLRMAPDRFPDL